MTTWLIIHKGPEWHVWPLGELADDDELQDLIMRARVAVGFPDGDEWVKDIAQTTIQITHGEPHPDMMARATVHDRVELAAVDAAGLAAYRGRCHEATRQARIEAARQALAPLSDADRRALLGGGATR